MIDQKTKLIELKVVGQKRGETWSMSVWEKSKPTFFLKKKIKNKPTQTDD